MYALGRFIAIAFPFRFAAFLFFLLPNLRLKTHTKNSHKKTYTHTDSIHTIPIIIHLLLAAIALILLSPMLRAFFLLPL